MGFWVLGCLSCVIKGFLGIFGLLCGFDVWVRVGLLVLECGWRCLLFCALICCLRLVS